MLKYIKIATLLCASLWFAGSAQAQELNIRRLDTTQWPALRLAVEVPEQDDIPAHYRLQITPSQTIEASEVVRLNEQPRPANLVIAVDTSRSLSPEHLTATKEALSRYVDQLQSGEQIALLGFNDDVQLATGFTNDREMLKANLDKLQLAGNRTELYRSMLYGVELLKNLPGQRALVVVTDGKDEGTTITRDQVIQLARDNDVRISGIGIPALPGDESEQYLPGIRDFTAQTGGLYRDAANAADLSSAAYDILVANGMPSTNVYAITFQGTDAAASATPAPINLTLVHEQDGLTQTAPLTFQNPVIMAAGPTALRESVRRVPTLMDGQVQYATGENTLADTVGMVENAQFTPVEPDTSVPASLAPMEPVMVEEAGMGTPVESAQTDRTSMTSGDTVRVTPAPANTVDPMRTEPTALTPVDSVPVENAAVGITEPVVVEEVAVAAPLATRATPHLDTQNYLHAFWPWLLLALLGLLLLWYLFRHRSEPLALEFPELAETFLLKPGTMIMGTSPDSHIRLNDPASKGIHAEFCINKECKGTSLNASHGALLNGEAVTKNTKLRPGDTLEFGNTRAIVKRADKNENYTTMQNTPV